MTIMPELFYAGVYTNKGTPDRYSPSSESSGVIKGMALRDYGVVTFT